MKKLLGLLGILTITSSGLSTLTNNSILLTKIENKNIKSLQNDPTIQQDISNKRFIKVLRDGTWNYIPNYEVIDINVGIVLREVQLRYLVTSESDWIAWVEQQESLLRTYHPEKIPVSQSSQHLEYDTNGEVTFTHWVSNARIKFLSNQLIFVQYLNNKYKEEQGRKERERIAANHEYNIRVQAQQQAEREYYRRKIDEFNKTIANNRAYWISNLMGSILTPLVSNTIDYQGGKFTFDWTPVTLLWWKLKIDNQGCEYLKMKLDSPEVAIAITGLQNTIEQLMRNLGPHAKALAKIASASVDLNIYIIKSIINTNKGNGVWIGFWINQPGIGWGSL